MAAQCPGKTANARLESVLVTCPGCGRRLEIFDDEPRVHCRCGQWVFREALPSCAAWCAAAERCFGSIGGTGPGAGRHAADERAEQARFVALQQRIAEALASCPTPEFKQKTHRENDSTLPDSQCH